ncbi:MAG: glycosyltransferase family 2 protein, partial [Candidatus Thorarchaeota archaeon]
MNTREITSDSTDSHIDRIYFDNSQIKFKKSDSEDRLLISVIIPLYNEEHSIKDVIEKTPNHSSYEIIVVDDGSTDNSVKKVKELNDKNIKVIHHDKNKGYGAAILSGLRNAAGDVIVTIDSDGQHNPEEIPKLVKPIINNQADIVIGSRYMGKFYYKNPFYARIGAYFINLFLRLLYLQKVNDNQCGFRAFKKDIVKIVKNLRCLGMGFSTELLFEAAYYKYRIKEVPISVNARKYGVSYVNLIKITKSIVSCILFYTLKKLNLNVKSVFSKNWIKR